MEYGKNTEIVFFTKMQQATNLSDRGLYFFPLISLWLVVIPSC